MTDITQQMANVNEEQLMTLEEFLADNDKMLAADPEVYVQDIPEDDEAVDKTVN